MNKYLPRLAELKRGKGISAPEASPRSGTYDTSGTKDLFYDILQCNNSDISVISTSNPTFGTYGTPVAAQKTTEKRDMGPCVISARSEPVFSSPPAKDALASDLRRDCDAHARAAPFKQGFAAFKLLRPAAGRFRHDQACWAAEMFMGEWLALATRFQWAPADIFTLPNGEDCGLAYWLGVDIVTALGPEHAATEQNRVFDRNTRRTWVNPYAGEPKH